MPKYRVTLEDGRVFDVEADAPPSEQDLTEYLGGAGSAAPSGASDSGENLAPWIAGGAALAAGAGALALHNPELAKTAASKIMDLRRLSMLSGLAPLKSFLGNVGGATYGSIERGSLEPLRELFSGQTAREAANVFRTGNVSGTIDPALQGVSKMNLPGRIMGALDTASQNALQRAGYTPEDAAREMLQGPIPHAVGEALDNPVANYLLPFRKTPLNQLLEGMRAFKADTLGKKAALGTSLATGAVTGYEAEDPKTIGLTTAASGRYGVPHALAAAAAYAAKGGNPSKARDIADAASDFGQTGQTVVGPVVNPLTVVPKPAAFSAYDYLRKLLGM